MRTLTFAILCFAVFCTACSKNNTSRTSTNGDVLPGIWELRSVSGGMLPANGSGISAGNGYIWKFTADHYERLVADSVYESGAYSVSAGTGTDLNTGRKVDQFIFNTTPSQSFELNNDTLKIFYGMIAADGVVEMYVKIADEDNSSAE